MKNSLISKILVAVVFIVGVTNCNVEAKTVAKDDNISYTYEWIGEDDACVTITAVKVFDPINRISPLVSQKKVSYIYTAIKKGDTASFVGKFVHDVTFTYGIPGDLAQINKGVATIVSQNSQSKYRMSINGTNSVNGSPAKFTSYVGVYLKSTGSLDGTIITTTICNSTGSSY